MCVNLVIKHPITKIIYLITDDGEFDVNMEKFSKIEKPMKEQTLDEIKTYIVKRNSVGPKIIMFGPNTIMSYNSSPIIETVQESIQRLNLSDKSPIEDFAKLNTISGFLVKYPRVFDLNDVEFCECFKDELVKDNTTLFYAHCGHKEMDKPLMTMVLSIIADILNHPETMKKRLGDIFYQLSMNGNLCGTKAYILEINKGGVQWL